MPAEWQIMQRHPEFAYRLLSLTSHLGGTAARPVRGDVVCYLCPRQVNEHFGLCLSSVLSYATMAPQKPMSSEGFGFERHCHAKSEYIVIDNSGAIVFPPDVPFAVAAVIGCAVAYSARVAVGCWAAVIGWGVGLSATQACKLAGCNSTIALDNAGQTGIRPAPRCHRDRERE